MEKREPLGMENFFVASYNALKPYKASIGDVALFKTWWTLFWICFHFVQLQAVAQWKYARDWMSEKLRWPSLFSSLTRLDACLTCSLLSRDNPPYVPFRCCGLSVPSKSTMDFHCRSRSPHSTVHVTSLIMLFLTVTERPSHYAISLVLRCARLCQYINASQKKKKQIVAHEMRSSV